MDADQKVFLIKTIGVIMIVVGFYIWMIFGGANGQLNAFYIVGAIMALLGGYFALFYGRTRTRDFEEQ